MRYHLQLLGMVLAVSLCLPMPVFAVKAHEQACNACHRSGANPRSMANVCTPCHERDVDPIGRFTSAKASDAMESHPNHLFPALITGDPGDQTSHFWGGSSSLKSAAGSTYPPTTFYSSRYSISTKRVTCSICHDPHKEILTQLIRETKDNDLICKQCHTSWFVLNDSADAIPGNDTNALLTHPIVTDYATFAAANSLNYQATPSNSSNGGSGEVRLVNGGVSCTSCHGVHFTDSDSSTIDGRAAIDNATLAEGDGHLLRADGPGKANKSALCQSCHTYKEHGKVGNDAFGSGVGDVQIGCLVCHGGHSYDATAPNYFILRKAVDTLAAGFGPQATLYTTSSTSWGSYCGSCHDINNIPNPGLRGAAHSSAEDCTMCHEHNATTYSFGKASSSTACSSCHGAPPRTDTAANRVDNTVPDTGYAVGSNGINYRSANQNGKDETTTPHKRHAGALNDDKVSVDYAFGSGTVLSACLPCHNDKEDAVNPPSLTHDEADSNLSFQDVYFNTFATYNGVLTPPAYSGTWTCSGIYCHSNGGKRTGAAKVLADFKTATTPPWLDGSNNTTNIGTIVGTATECQQCHGENRASMLLAEKNNSATHDKHLLKLGDGKTKCYLCHSATVDNTGTIPASARDHRLGGTHVNGTVNVVFSTTALNAELVGGTYPADNSGTCVVYCHSDAIGGPPALVPDWDFVTGTVVCGSCHGITAATLTSGSHPIHINSTKAKIKCSSCHDAGADTGIHGGHVNGVVDRMTAADSCNQCHGVELASGKSWDVSPTWGSAATADCRTCHTGSVLTSYVNTAAVTIAVTTVNNLSKPLHESDGHSRPTPFILTGKPEANKNCTACHVMPTPAGTGHVDGLGTSKLLIGGFSCESCHTAAGSRSNEATVDVQSHGNQTAGYIKKDQNVYFTKTCLACHDPHGTSNGAMIENLRTKQNAKDATSNFAGDVVFSALTITNSFDESDSGTNANNDDICATCHSTTLHNNRAATVANHHEGENCTTNCHGHNGAKGGFMPTGGTACNDCHGNPPTASDARPADSVGAHAAHTKVASHLPTEDLYDCAVCHQGGETFALDGAHSSAPLVAGIGYSAVDGTCSNACHLSTASDGYWNDIDGLDCASCHYYAASPTSAGNIVKPLSLTHSKHFDASKVCIDCHADNSADAGAHPDPELKRTHIDDNDAWDLNATNDGTVLADRGAATPDEATVIVTPWNDETNTCSNAACHNPSGLSNSATWGTPNAVACDFCHSSTNPDAGKVTPGSHGAHMNATGIFGIDTIDCNSCHPNNALIGNGHLNSAVDLNVGFVYNASLTDYTPSTYGQCTTTTCHNNGRGVEVQTPVPWGTAYDNCSICHNNGSGAAQPNTGRHNKHVANTSYVASACGNCHANATATTMTGATTHINGTAQTGIDITAHTAGTATCTNNCHLVDLARGDWLDANFLTCTDCHGRAGSAGGAYPTSGLHVGPLTISANTHDDNFKVTRNEVTPSGICLTCHSGINLAGDLPATHIAGGAPAAAQAALATDINYVGGSPSTCAPKVGLATCHDDGGAWNRKWKITARNSDDTQCGNCHGDFDRGWAGGVVARHSGDAQVEAGHDGVDKCYMCHTFKKGVTVPYDFAVKHRDGKIQINNDMVFTDSGAAVNTCNGCHDSGAGPYGTADGQYGFIDTNKDDTADGGVNRWSREMIVGGPVGNCNGCHVSFGRNHTGTNESAAVHLYHTGSPMSPGCGACHPADSGPGGLLHENNTVDFGGTYLTTALNYTGADFANTNCSSANGCHNSDDNSWVADSLATCADCHVAPGKLLNQGTVFPPNSNAHTQHLGNAAYVGTVGVDACDACHGAGSSAANHLSTHNDGNVTVINAITAYTLIADTGNGTCTNNCHTVVSGRDWNDATTLICADCHAAAKLLPSLDAYPPTSAKHTPHINQDTYVAGDCADCHGLDSATGAHASHKDGMIDDTVAYASATQTCTISCHIVTTGDWTAGALVCRDCHADTYVGGGSNLPASGLHAITPTTSGAKHDHTLQTGNCVNCHSTTPSNLHKNGALNSSATATFTFNANVSSYVAATGCNASCHADDGAWARKWSLTADDGGTAVCANCHGTFVSGFTAGVVARHQTTSSGDDDGQIATSHDGVDQCYTCHAYKPTDLSAYDFASNHRDNMIQVNQNGGWTDNVTLVGCAGCHNATDGTADEGHQFEVSTSRWTRQLVAGPSADCVSCHDHTGTNESLSTHDLHTNSSLFVGGCAACHPHTGPGSGLHNDGNIDFGGTYLTTALNTIGTDFTNTNCSTANGCHDSDTGEWASMTLGADKCNDCHASGTKVLNQNNMYPPTGNKHTVHINQNVYVAGDCDDCHGAGAATGVHATHRNGAINDTLTYISLNATCENSCHTASVNDLWTTGALVCADCHGSGKALDAGGEADLSVSIGPNAGEHDIHMANSNFVGGGCAACHGHNGAIGAVDGHVNGPNVATITVATSVTSYSTTLATCANACHSVVDGNDWLSATGLNCADCHAGGGTLDQGAWPVDSAKHTKHINSNTYVLNDCGDCHGADAATGAHSGHKNGAVNNTVTYASATQTCTITCHVANTTGDWTVGGALACRDCHAAGNFVASTALPVSGLHAITPTVSATKHDDTLSSGNCVNCHDATSPSNLHKDGIKQNSSTATFTFDSNVTAYSAAGCTATCHADAGDWARKWSTSAANSDGSECANCHGGIGVGYTASTWNTGIIPDHTANWDSDVNGPEVMTSHSVCKSCHGFNGAADKDDNYLLTMHRNNSITMNGGTNYNAANWGCDNAGCHGDAASGHALADSGWTVELGAFAAGGDCFGCHGNGVDQYWPDGSAYPDRAGAHIQHIPEIAAKMTGGDTLANRNATCIYCHPGGAHSGDQSASPADVCNTDTNNDGTADANTADKMIKLILNAGNPVPDSNGFWRSTPGTCSTVACHASAPYTPHWYVDNVVPDAILNLASVASTVPGTVQLTWNATGDDGSLDGTAYIYDVRYRPSADGAISAGNWTDVNTKQAGNPPTVDRMSKAQSMIVDGLTADTSYTFAVKTADERYPDVAAWSAISNVVTASAQTDNVAPTFWGVDTAVSDCGGGVNLTWAAARDHTLPIGYRVYWSTASLKEHLANGGTLPVTTTCYDAGSPPTENGTCTAPDYTIITTTTTALKYRVTGLPPGVLYHFLVRAYDGAGTPNYDQNDDELMQMGQSTPSLPFTLGTYYANGTVTSSIVSMNNTGFTTTGTITLVESTGNVVFAAPAYTQQKNAVAISMDVYVKEDDRATGQQLKYWFGYVTGTTFYYITPSGTPNILDIGKSSARVRKLPLGGATGTIPSGSQAAVRLQNGTALGTLTVNWGTTANSGLLLVNEQQFNNLPTAPVVNPNPPTVLGTPTPGVVNIVWNPSTDADSHAVHYDVFGSIDNGATFPFVIGRMLTGTSISWDTIGDGILANYTNTVRVKVIAGDTYLDGTLGSELHHSEAISNAFSLSNSIDGWPPAAVNDLIVETRPKQGAVALSWTAVGNDGYNHGSRAGVYDIRYSTSNITDDTTFNAASPALGEPAPTFSGERESYELLGLAPDTTYYFAMKVGDEAGNWSGISNVPSMKAGPKCGICHSTPPDESATAGNHIKHGYTMNDCANCHGSEAATFTTAHQDGQLKLGWKTATPYAGIQDGTRLYYTLNGLAGGTVIYDDNGLADLGASAGAGGFVNTGGDQIDNGRCFAFNAAGASGCHGPATPDWDVNETLACSACHGESGRTIDPYGRAYDDTSTDVSASPPVDNHGNSSGIYVGAHLKHLNFSFRLSKGDSCRLCHKDNLHADSNVDVTYDLAATGETALYTEAADGVGTAASCGGTSVDTCHGTANTPRWDNTVEPVDCVGCHGFNGTTPNHVTDGSVRACTWCHPAGHPQGTGDTSTYEIPNNMAVGINYKSGGIHLLRTINGRGPYTTEAQICWGCHDANSVSEWGLDSSNANTVTDPGNSNAYNFGALFTAVGFTGPTSNWLGLGTGAYWQSGTSLFQTVKKGKIQSTHSTSPGGTSAVSYDATNKRYNETLDAVADLRCSNCHDVHNMNKAKNDATSGAPYLRGTWKSNPYKEDGPPLLTSNYSSHTNGGVGGYGAVPRGGTAWTETGGYYIDQNSGSPTTGWTLEGSAGLCVLCHGSDVDNMDQTTDENLWMDVDTVTNGHSNSAVGGTFSKSVNIFDHGASSYSGRPTAVTVVALTSATFTAQIPDMQFQTQAGAYTGGAGYRGTASTGTYNGGYQPTLVSKGHQNDAFTWGVTIDAGTKDVMYHQFSCSKCHNPHASRLPKLLITNCLDVQHNTWDNSLATPNTQSLYTNAALTAVDRGRTAAYYASAANCHRYSDLQGKGGWNKVSPWTTANQ